MRMQFSRPFASIKGALSEEELPDFLVIVGKNGAGKSNLLQAISRGSVHIDQIFETQIRTFDSATFAPKDEGTESAKDLEAWSRVAYFSFREFAEQVIGMSPAEWPKTFSSEIRQTLRRYLTDHWFTEAALHRFEELTGKEVNEFSLEDLRTFGPISGGKQDPFVQNLSDLFAAYHQRKNGNQFERWLVGTQNRTDLNPLSEDLFLEVNGPPPWTVLDEILEQLELRYTFVPPTGADNASSTDFVTAMKSLDNQTIISPSALSSGEKTLLTLATSILVQRGVTKSAALPQLLLLDEIDASLHPSMVRSLMSVLYETFHLGYQVKIIMTTHSPTTVALSPEKSIYVMRKSKKPRPVSASSDLALAELTVGIPTLSVRVENRRQVFVESKKDEQCLTMIYGLIRVGLKSPFSLNFVASGQGDKTGNRQAVLDLVDQLVRHGNSTVWGIIDRDSAPPKTLPRKVILANERYTLENFLIDPLALGLYLERGLKLTAEDLGLPAGTDYASIKPEMFQAVVDSVCRLVQLPGHAPEKKVTYYGGWSVILPGSWLETPGHVLEERVHAAFPGVRWGGPDLKLSLIRALYTPRPDLLPNALVDVLRTISGQDETSAREGIAQ